MAPKEKSIFHTDQGRWDLRDFEERFSVEPDDESYFLEDEPQEYIKPAGHVYTDAELETVAGKLLQDSPDVDEQDIRIKVKDGNITLSGNVTSKEQKENASKVLQLIQGIGNIFNQLNIKQ